MAMPELPDSQKNISKGYAGNLSYFRRPHYLRRLRFWAFSLTLVATLVGAWLYGKWGSAKAFNTGTLSQNHAHLADRCETCHTGSESKNDAAFINSLGKFATLSSVEAMDAACMKCHAGTGLHAPQTALVNLKAPSNGGLVHASACASCHREHAGPQRMALPSSQTCTECHGSATKLEASRSATTPAKALPTQQPTPTLASGEAVDLGNGLLVYLPPVRAQEVTPAFASFAHGHPSFGYEAPEARDPADLKFNHARHFRSDIPQLNNAKLDCASCHQPEANGAFMQPVRYEKHCQECHSLQLQQSLPNLHIPHGDSNTVKFFLTGLESSIEATVKASGVTDSLAVANRVQEEKDALQKRGLFSVQDLQKRVFIQGDPQDFGGERLMRSGKPKFLTECAKCHTVKEREDGMGYAVQATNVSQRWLVKGAFSHLPHKQSACTDCHGAALKSKATSDILLPTQQSCAECHQPFAAGKEGVKFSCDSCHHFHSAITPAPPAPLEAAVRVNTPATSPHLQP